MSDRRPGSGPGVISALALPLPDGRRLPSHGETERVIAQQVQAEPAAALAFDPLPPPRDLFSHDGPKTSFA